MTERRKTVLLIEDDGDLRDAVGEVLAECGYTVLAAGDGEQGLSALRGQDGVDLILLDLMMPGMNGYEFRQRQLADAAVAHIPVVVFTAGVDKPPAALGEVTYLRKPVDLDDLVRTVARCLG
jgi:two-component system chemotaxis response regulator CheY